ncbi:MAG: c-type cytochrome [Saprospiraceae bacterium]|nr:c-type cytochrome [Saprospiraceae bacterium]
MKTKISLLFFLFPLLFSSCLKDDVKTVSSVFTDEELTMLDQYLELPPEILDYQVTLPNYLTSSLRPVQVDNKRATLGRVLFYDKNLSKNKTISCASCHKQELAFADDKAFSEGFDGELTARNSLALGSVVNFSAYYSSEINSFGIRFFWDERAGTVAEQSKMTLGDKIEMGMDMHEVVSRLKELEYYKPLFSMAYGSEEISEAKALAAITDFIMGMGSYDSGYDRVMSSPNGANGFNPAQKLGKQLYDAHCSSCHGFNAGRPTIVTANNGLDETYTDKGVGGLNNVVSEYGVFKVPTLRNIALTAPYMHDGRFETLEEVIEHYSTGIKYHRNLSDRLKDFNNGQGEPRRFNFSSEEKNALKLFLETLTDQTFITDEKFSDPFKQ